MSNLGCWMDLFKSNAIFCDNSKNCLQTNPLKDRVSTPRLPNTLGLEAFKIIWTPKDQIWAGIWKTKKTNPLKDV